MDASISKTVLGVFVAAVVLLGAQLASAMSMEETCGNANDSMAAFSQGRWLSWSQDTLYQEGLDTVLIDAQRKQLTEMAEPFMRLDVLNPPQGVEARPHRIIGARQSMGEPMAGSELMVQIFHPTYKQAGTASASIRLSVNKLSPVFYGIGGGEIKDEMGPMFPEPIRVGELGGAPVYWSERPRDCIVVYKAHERPLWKPVSQERYLLAQIQLLEHKIEDARSEFLAARRSQGTRSDNSLDMAQQEELIKQIRASNPQAAEKMEKQFAEMRRMKQKKLSDLQSGADSDFDRMGKPLYAEIDKFKAELSAMTPAERAAQAYLGGISGSKVTLLSRPDDSGARPLIAPAKDYFSEQPHQSNIQLLLIEFRSAADHPPETTINVRLRKELDWRQFWQFVSKQ
jgi:hypothetical protein